MYSWKTIDWTDPSADIADNFTVGEALLLPSWGIYHIPSDNEKQEIVKTAGKMQQIRNLFSAIIIVHCWVRPICVNCLGNVHHGENYNLYIGSKSENSPHIYGKAVDFHVFGFRGVEGCKIARFRMLPQLEDWGIRMEDMRGGWIHIDTNPVINNRFFKP